MINRYQLVGNTAGIIEVYDLATRRVVGDYPEAEAEKLATCLNDEIDNRIKQLPQKRFKIIHTGASHGPWSVYDLREKNYPHMNISQEEATELSDALSEYWYQIDVMKVYRM